MNPFGLEQSDLVWSILARSRTRQRLALLLHLAVGRLRERMRGHRKSGQAWQIEPLAVGFSFFLNCLAEGSIEIYPESVAISGALVNSLRRSGCSSAW